MNNDNLEQLRRNGQEHLALFAEADDHFSEIVNDEFQKMLDEALALETSCDDAAKLHAFWSVLACAYEGLGITPPWEAAA
jgi:hypothetical protein